MTTSLRLLAAVVVLCLSGVGAVAQERRAYSVEKERQLGRQLASEVEQRVNLVDAPILASYINGVARRLSEHCPYRLPIEVRVIAADQMNGSALPGGYVYVNSGAIRSAGSEAEVAGVIAHLIAHSRGGGLLRTGGRPGNAARLDPPLIFVGGWNGHAFQRSESRPPVPLSFMQAQRAMVFEADEGGLLCLYEAGYDPQGLVRVLKRLPTEEPTYSTHPSGAERLNRVEALLTSLPPRPAYLADVPEFSEAKRRVEAMQKEQPRRSASPPSLRRK